MNQKLSKPIILVSMILLIAGVFCYSQMQTVLFPEVLFPRMKLIAEAGSQPVDRMMITVTKPMESAVKKVQGVSLADFARDVEAKAEDIRAQLPQGYELKTYYNQSAFVSDSINSVLRTIYEGLFLAMIVMVFFLHSWRSSMVVMLTIPVTVAFSLVLMYAASITINVMSLGAIAASVGLIIDDAIVIIEQIYREYEERQDITAHEAARRAVRYLLPAMVASSRATIAVFFPFRLMSGRAGSFFRELSTSMQLTLVASFLVTWLLLPVLHLLIGYKKKKSEAATAE